MKKIKKLKLRPNQKLDALQQQNVMAAGYGDWQGGCSCTQVGNSHVETCEEQSKVTDYGTAIGGCLIMATGTLIGLTGVFGEAPSAGTSTVLIGTGISLIAEGKQITDGATKTLTRTWTRTMHCTQIKPIAHKAGKITCTSTLL